MMKPRMPTMVARKNCRRMYTSSSFRPRSRLARRDLFDASFVLVRSCMQIAEHNGTADKRPMIQHSALVRVRYADTDQMGLVYYGKYFEYFEVARTEMLRACGLPYAEIEKA